MRSGISFPTIASGAVMSNAFRIKGAGPIGVGAPVINSANVFLQAGFDSTPAAMVRVQRQALAAADCYLQLDLGGGSRQLCHHGVGRGGSISMDALRDQRCSN